MIPRARHREEVLNVELARLLGDRGIVAAPEQIVQGSASERRLPDVTVVDHQGLRTTIEGKYNEGDAARVALRQAEARVEEGIAQIALAVLYRPELRSTPYPQLAGRLGESSVRVAVVTEAATGGWSEGGINEIADLLRRGFSDLLREDVVAEATLLVEKAVDSFARTLLDSRGAARRVTEVLNASSIRTNRPGANNG